MCESKGIKKSVRGIATLVLLGAAFAPSAETGLTTPQIHHVAVDAWEHRLVIDGQDFGPASPFVRLGQQALRVEQFAGDHIVAALPADVRPAAYRLTVTSADESGASGHLDITIPKLPRRAHSRGR